MYEIFEQLLKKYCVTPYRIHKETGVPQSTLSDWKNGKGTPKIDKLKKIADYFGVTVDYLIGGNEQKESAPALTEKDERDISKKMEETLAQLEGQQLGLMFDGEPLDEETKELLAISLKSSLELAKKIAKQKYTPKKYQKKLE
jgi:transcriptional regulator with XRE-family HTH domain